MRKLPFPNFIPTDLHDVTASPDSDGATPWLNITTRFPADFLVEELNDTLESVNETVDSSLVNTALHDVQGDLLWWAWIPIFVLISINISTVFGNLLILTCWWNNPSLHIPANVNIVSLAVSDLALGVFILPLSVLKTSFDRWLLPNLMCKTWLYFDLLLSTVSIYNLINIAMDRLHAVRKPISYSVQCTVSSAVKKVVCCWLVGSLLAVPVLWIPNDYNTCGFLVYDNRWLPNYLIIVCFFTPFSLITVVYTIIFRTFQNRLSSKYQSTQIVCNTAVTMTQLIKSEKEDMTTSSEGPSSSSRSRATSVNQRILNTAVARERRMLVVMVVVVGCFLVCYLPFWITYIVILNCKKCPLPSKLMLIALQWLAYSNSAVNPIIYTVFNQDYRNAVRSIYTKISGCVKRS